MNSTLSSLTKFLNQGWLHDHVVNWLRTVWGLPPIVQAVHIFCIAIVMASIVMIDLRILDLALKGQNIREMMQRLFPWLWTALVLLLISGGMFVIARPRRYFVNPVFGIKFALLAVAIVLTLILYRLQRNSEAASRAAKALASLSLVAWLGVMMAGRWIAYADYLFSPE